MHKLRSSKLFVSAIALACLLYASTVTCCLPGDLMTGSPAHAADCPSGADTTRHDDAVLAEEGSGPWPCAHADAGACTAGGELVSVVTLKSPPLVDVQSPRGDNELIVATAYIPDRHSLPRVALTLPVGDPSPGDVPVFLMTARIRV